MTVGGQKAPVEDARPLRLTLAVAAPRVAPRDIERFLASQSAAGLGAADEVSIAASPATGSDARDFDRWLELGASISPGPSSAALRFTLHACETTPMRLWGHAMARARGSHVAVLDARDTLAPGWVRAWAEAAEASGDAICFGPVDPGQLSDSCSWAAYLSEYGRFWSPLAADDTAELPGNNIVFPRDSLPADETLESQGFWKTFHLVTLRDDHGGGDSLALAPCPGMVVRVERRYRLTEYLRRRYLHGRCYGGRRLEQPGAPPRLLCLGFTPLLPAVRTARVLRRVAKRLELLWAQPDPQADPPAGSLPARRGWPAAAFAPLVLGEIAWSWGEFNGYARGAGSACEELW